MQEMDCIEVTVEKEKYARHGVHKGMQGWICDPRCINEAWLVNFPQCGEKDDIATIGQFVESEYCPVPEDVVEQYDVNSWLSKF